MEITAASGQCDGCGRIGVLAEARLWANAPGLVLRCVGCDGVLLRVVSGGGRTWLDLRGLRYSSSPTGPPGHRGGSALWVERQLNAGVRRQKFLDHRNRGREAGGSAVKGSPELALLHVADDHAEPVELRTQLCDVRRFSSFSSARLRALSTALAPGGRPSAPSTQGRNARAVRVAVVAPRVAVRAERGGQCRPAAGRTSRGRSPRRCWTAGRAPCRRRKPRRSACARSVVVFSSRCRRRSVLLTVTVSRSAAPMSASTRPTIAPTASAPIVSGVPEKRSMSSNGPCIGAHGSEVTQPAIASRPHAAAPAPSSGNTDPGPATPHRW